MFDLYCNHLLKHSEGLVCYVGLYAHFLTQICTPRKMNDKLIKANGWKSKGTKE